MTAPPPDGYENHIVALSGGKDSTAMALRLAEVEPRDYIYACTPTGDELPQMVAHWERLECLLGTPLTRITSHDRTLGFWIGFFNALPSHRMRWCTRLLKIEPYLAWLKTLTGKTVSYVGLRADEETRTGIISDDIECRFPLREWGWGLADVWQYLRGRGVDIPPRTDCARCYEQRLGEWWDLWRYHPDIYEQAAAHEDAMGATFRSPSRDAWPASLRGMKEQFEVGRIPRNASEPTLFDEDGRSAACRVCSL